MLDVSKGGKPVTTLSTTRGFYPSQDPTQGLIGRFFNGEADSNVGLHAGLTKDIWTVVNPDLTPLQALTSTRATTCSQRALEDDEGRPGPGARAAAGRVNELWTLRDQAITGIAAATSPIRGRSSSC